MKISIVQSDVMYRDKKGNIQKLAAMLDSTNEVGELVLLPELFSTAYVFEQA